MQPISKFVQIAISHLTGNLLYQFIDRKEFLQKVDTINETYSPFSDAACFAVCDVMSLHPNVNNETEVTGYGKTPEVQDNPNPKFPSRCIL